MDACFCIVPLYGTYLNLQNNCEDSNKHPQNLLSDSRLAVPIRVSHSHSHKHSLWQLASRTGLKARRKLQAKKSPPKRASYCLTVRSLCTFVFINRIKNQFGERCILFRISHFIHQVTQNLRRFFRTTFSGDRNRKAFSGFFFVPD